MREGGVDAIIDQRTLEELEQELDQPVVRQALENFVHDYFLGAGWFASACNSLLTPSPSSPRLP